MSDLPPPEPPLLRAGERASHPKGARSERRASNTSRGVVCGLWLAPLLCFGGVVWSARPPTPRHEPATHALAAVLPAPDLALASGARALRMPSLEERWASSQDHPGELDLDPAGATFYPEPTP